MRDVGRIPSGLVENADIEIGEAWTEVDRSELPFRGQISIINAKQQLGSSPRYAQLEAGVAAYVERLRQYLGEGGTLTPRPKVDNAPGG